MNKIPDYFAQSEPTYHQTCVNQDFLVGIEKDAEQIAIYIQQCVDNGQSAMGYNALRDQVKTYTDEFNSAEILLDNCPITSNSNPRLECF